MTGILDGIMLEEGRMDRYRLEGWKKCLNQANNESSVGRKDEKCPTF